MPGEVWIGLPVALAVAGGSAAYAFALRRGLRALDAQEAPHPHPGGNCRAAETASGIRNRQRERRGLGRRLRLAWIGTALGATMALALLTPPRERPSLFVAAWFSTALLALTAGLFAAADLWATRMESRAERTRLQWEKQALERRLGRGPGPDA